MTPPQNIMRKYLLVYSFTSGSLTAIQVFYFFNIIKVQAGIYTFSLITVSLNPKFIIYIYS